MLIYLDQVRREPVSWDVTVDVDVDDLDRDDVVSLSPMKWSGRVSEAEVEDEAGFFLSARYDYRQSLACQRCLEPVEQPVAGDITLLLVQGAPRPVDGEQRLEEEDLGVVHVQGAEYDTRPLLLEQMQLNVPMKPVCRDDCKGLCPRCGANLNEGECGCEDDWEDPRWAALKDFKPKGSGAGSE